MFASTVLAENCEEDTLSIESECPMMLRFLRNTFANLDVNECLLIMMKHIKYFSLPPAYIEPPPCTIPAEDHACCCDCDGFNDAIENPYVLCYGRKRTFSYPKKDKRCQLIVSRSDLQLTKKFGKIGEKLINHAGTNTIIVLDPSGKERKTNRCEPYPPKNEYVLCCKSIASPDLPHSDLWKIIDRVTGREEFMFSERY